MLQEMEPESGKSFIFFDNQPTTATVSIQPFIYLGVLRPLLDIFFVSFVLNAVAMCRASITVISRTLVT